MSVANGTTDRTKTKTERSQFFLEMANIRSPENAEVKFVSKRGEACANFLTSPHNVCEQSEDEGEARQRSTAGDGLG